MNMQNTMGQTQGDINGVLWQTNKESTKETGDSLEDGAFQ